MFHQLEGLVLESGIHIGYLKGCLIDFCRAFFKNEKLNVRFRPSFFPFTEPSLEVDILYTSPKGEKKWLEILGAGMVHPNVLENCKIDSRKHQGFAFGMGIERLVMLKYGLTDIRALYQSDQRWLDHYGQRY
jgi:phenylalanyl-tRNA synthetase alpha chain